MEFFPTRKNKTKKACVSIICATINFGFCVNQSAVKMDEGGHLCMAINDKSKILYQRSLTPTTHQTLRNNKQNRKLYAIDLRRINIVVPKMPINLCQFCQIASTFRKNNDFYLYPLFYFQVSKYTLLNANCKSMNMLHNWNKSKNRSEYMQPIAYSNMRMDSFVYRCDGDW